MLRGIRCGDGAGRPGGAVKRVDPDRLTGASAQRLRDLSAKNFIAGVTILGRGTKVGKVTASAAATVYTRSADCYGRDHICAWLEVAGAYMRYRV